MTQIPLELLPKVYAYLMAHIKERLEFANDYLQAANRRYDAGDRRGYLDVEAAFLQLRMACEYFAYAVLAAHTRMPSAKTSKLMTEWNADIVFTVLETVNPQAFPRRFREFPPDGGTLVIESTGYMTRADLKAMYKACGKNLHSGSLKVAIGSKKRSVDISEANEWLHRLGKLFERHVVLLPQKGLSLTMLIRGDRAHPTEGSPECAVWKDEVRPDGTHWMRCLHHATGHLPHDRLETDQPTT